MVQTGDGQAQAAFDAFRSRHAVDVPEELREGAPVPQTWPYSRESWEVFAEEAREHLRLKPLHDFAYRIAVLGFFPDELATGQLRHGAEIKVATGRVFRHRPAHDEPTMRRARQLVHEMAQAQVQLDPILQLDLENISVGRPVGHAKRVKVVIEAAESALHQHHAQREATAREEAARPLLTVHRPFRAIGGKNYAAGTYRVDPSVAAELQDWRERMETQARERGWDTPGGLDGTNWPPFSLKDD